MSRPPGPRLAKFVDEVRETVAAGGGERWVTAAVATRLRALLADDRGFLRTGYTQPDPDRYVVYPLHVEDDGSFSVAAAVWDIGQVSPIHDHGTWGVIGIYDGVEHERRFEPPVAPGAAAPRFLGESDLRPGEVAVCCTSDQDVHEVSCASPVACVGIHVYGADIGSIERRSYDPRTGHVKMFVSDWAQPAG
jgi:predicted metal-dependent enzyme (double-stranded beta helix superfamily)